MRKIALITLAVLFPFLTGIIGWWIGQKADVREIKSSISLVKSKPLDFSIDPGSSCYLYIKRCT